MAALQLTVTPGTNFTEEGAVTADDLNLAAAPGVSIPEGAIQPEHIDTDALAGAIGDSLRGENFVPWGTFAPEEMLAAAMTCTAGQRNPVHPGWWVLPTGADLTAEHSARTAAATANEAGRSALKVTGNTSLTALVVGTYVPPGLAQILSGGNMTFSVYVYNKTGTAFTLALEVKCSNTSGDEGNVSLQSTVSGSGSCADSQWTRVEFDFDASAVTNFYKGAQFQITLAAGAGVMNSGTDYLLLADAQIDKGVLAATPLKQNPPVPELVPAGTVLAYTGAYNLVPPGFLFCDGSAVSRARYARLFYRQSTLYGAGDGTTTFNLPDGRGRTLVGAEISGSSQGRLEVTVTAASSSGDVITFAPGETRKLRLGMGVYGNAFIPADATLIALTETTGQLSAATTGNVTGTLRASKLGAKDAETVGSAGGGMGGGRRLRKVVLPGTCSVTSASNVLTPPGSTETIKIAMLARIVPGMLIDDGAGGSVIAVGTTVLGFQFLSGASSEIGRIIMSANAASSTSISASFTMRDPEGENAEYVAMKEDQVVLYGCNWGSGTTQLDIGDISRLRIGQRVTSGTAGLPTSGYVVGLTAGAPDFATLSAVTTGVGSNAAVTFAGSDELRETVPATTPGPGMQTVNWIIKY